jgi:predicted nucleic-acid-binding Zn-ribbon protein
MPLTEVQERRLVSWCNARGIRATCPMCGSNDWSAGELVSPPPAEASEFLDEEAAAMVQIICDHCKLVMLFAAAPVLGGNP